MSEEVLVEVVDGIVEVTINRPEAKNAMTKAAAEAIAAAMDRLDFSTAIVAVKSFVDAVNMYVTEQEPWVLAKDEAQTERLHTVLYTICESLRAMAVLYYPLMPNTMSELWNDLGAAATLGAIADQRVSDVANWGQLPVGAPVTKGAGLFPRLEEVAE